MNRRDRDRYDYDRNRNDRGSDYGRYEGYNRDDDHYHSARNLTNEFERDFQRERGYSNDDRDRYSSSNRSYHEGDMGDAYERMSRERGRYDEQNRNYSGNDRNYSGNDSRNRERYGDYQDNYRGRQDMNRGDRDRYQDRGGYSGVGSDDTRGSGFSGGYGQTRDNRYGSDRGSRTEDNWRNSGRGRGGYENRYY
jgi:hypothetical protein